MAEACWMTLESEDRHPPALSKRRNILCRWFHFPFGPRGYRDCIETVSMSKGWSQWHWSVQPSNILWSRAPVIAKTTA